MKNSSKILRIVFALALSLSNVSLRALGGSCGNRVHGLTCAERCVRESITTHQSHRPAFGHACCQNYSEAPLLTGTFDHAPAMNAPEIVLTLHTF